MEKDQLKCVTIEHKEDQMKEYRWLSGYFRMMGIFVVQRSIEISAIADTDLIFSFVQNDRQESNYIYICQPFEETKKWLCGVLKKVKDVFSADVYEEMQNIASIYCKYDLMRSSYAIQYFADSDNIDVLTYMLQSALNFNRAYQKLKNKNDKSKYFLMAKCNCQRRINELYRILWNYSQRSGKSIEGSNCLKLIPYSEIKSGIEEILKKDNQFFGAYAVQGFVESLETTHLEKSGFSFEIAAKIIGDKSYASCLYYHIGNFFERILLNQKEAYDNYWKAYKLNETNYRAIYKIAYTAYENEEFEKAIEYFDKIRNLLDFKEDHSFLQPIECAYLYKTYKLLGQIYMLKGEYVFAKILLRKAYAFKEKEENIPFYIWIYGNSAYAFKKAAIDKLKLEQCERDLLDVYAMLNEIVE